jgi:tripartite-type tricarboxylate transporter receptor subunit TctC
MRYLDRRAFALAVLFCGVTYVAHAQDWIPSRPINLIVPWAAGGSTDQATRVAAAGLEDVLRQKIVIINQPGASGSIGTRSALDAPKDGYTWTSGAAQDLGTYETLGMLKTNIKDWHLYLTVANIEVLSVAASSPFKTAKDVIDAMKAKPGQVSVATAGVQSSGHSAMERIAQAAGVTYKNVTYDGGAPAVVATVSGETQATTQLAVEQTEMILGKRLRPLAVIGDKPLQIEGYGRIEPLTSVLPNLKSPVNYFGIFVPPGVPEEVTKTLDKIWAEKMPQDSALKQYATKRGALFSPIAGEEAQKAVIPAVQANAWQQFNAGKAKVSPDTLGIAKP